MKFIRHQPTDRDHGQMTLEFSGRSNRIGAEIITQHGSDLEPTNLKFVPSTKMTVLYGTNLGTTEVFQTFIARPKDEQERNALGLVALARKAIGLGA